MNKIGIGLFIFEVTFILADFTPYRGECSRFGKFDIHIKDSVLVGHVIAASQVPTRIDCVFECLSNLRCVSYNYEEGNKVLHECELNSEGKESKSDNFTGKAGYSYYGTKENVPDACASSPCINEGSCQDSCMEGTGYKCVCIEGRMGDKCQNWTNTAQDYEVLFSEESTTDYIESEVNEILQQFTLCFWMKSHLLGWATIFSHMTPDNKRDLTLRCGPQMYKCHLTLVEDQRLIYMAPLVNNIWHHICVSWENVQGLWDVLVDGTVMAHGSDWGQTLSVRPGKLVVGLSQEVYGEGFTAGESFKGNVASLNIWSTKVTNSVIKEKANSCSYDLGNVIDWRTFRHGAHGNVKILSPQSCISHVTDSEFLLDFLVRQNTSYVETVTLPLLREFTLSFWMKRGFDGSLKGAIMSYTTIQELKSLQLYLGITGSLNVRIMDSSSNHIIYRLPPINDDQWHHMCITWTNVDGKALVYLDGVLKYATSGYKVGITIPSGGIMRIGQHQRELGGDHNPELSYRGKFAKINMWSTVLDGSVIVALSNSPGAENGDAISWRDMRTALINGNVMVQDVNSIQLTAQENDFDIVFASKSSANYADYNAAIPSLTMFTACVWIKMSHDHDGHYFFTYATSSSYQSIALGYYPGSLKLYFNVHTTDWQDYILSSDLHDNGWHHLCLTWRNTDGKACLFLDGTTLMCTTSYQTGQTIPANGKFILGQEQDSLGGSFESDQAFEGSLSRVNVWNFVINSNAIIEMSRGCGLWSGNAVAWYNFKNNIFGNIEIDTPSSCSLPVATVQAKRDDYCQNRYGVAPEATCGTTLRALFDSKSNQVGKVWRCFYDVALTTDPQSNMYVYDTVKNSGCLHSVTEDLLAIND